MDVDPLASLRCWAIEIELGGRVYQIPALSASDWWPVLVSGRMESPLDFIVSNPADPFNIDDLLLSGRVTWDELGTVITDVIEEISGRSLQATFVLAGMAARNWPVVSGRMALRGFRWDVMPIGAALDAIYVIAVELMHKDDLAKFEKLLNAKTATSKPDRDKMLNEFEEIAGPRPTSGVKATGAPSDNARPRTRQRPRPPHQPGPLRVPRKPRAPRAGSGPPASS